MVCNLHIIRFKIEIFFGIILISFVVLQKRSCSNKTAVTCEEDALAADGHTEDDARVVEVVGEELFER